jgi:trimeric autotransporter adhesin
MVNKQDTLTSVLVAPAAMSAKSFTMVATVGFHALQIDAAPFAIPSTGNVSSSPTGSVNFYDGTTPIGTAALIQGINFTSTATLTVTIAPASVSAAYYGDNNFNGSTSASTPLAGGAPVIVSLGAGGGSLTYGQALPLVATVTPEILGSPTPTGTLTFFDGSQNLGWTATLDAAGSSTLPIPAPLPTAAVCAPACPAAAPMMVLSAGAHSLTVT